MATIPYPACQGQDAEPIPASFALPVGTVDCRAHIIGTLDRYPFWPMRGYTPPPTTFGQYQHLHLLLDCLPEAKREMSFEVSFVHPGYTRTDFGMQHQSFR